jgi:class 3 adenylate cyclase
MRSWKPPVRHARCFWPSTRAAQIFLSPEVPEEVARFAAQEFVPEVPDSVLATVLFTDIVGSTERAAALGDRAWRELLERHHGLVRRELARFRGDEQDTAGNAFFATFDGPARAIRCAQAIVESLRALGLDVRAGVHTGECELHDGKVAGLAVSIGARVASAAGAGEVLVSQTVKDLGAGTGLFLADRGEHELKARPAPGGSTRPPRARARANAATRRGRAG